MDIQNINVELNKIPYLYNSQYLFDEFLLFGYSSIEKHKICQGLKQPKGTIDIDPSFPLYDNANKYKAIINTVYPSLLSEIKNENKTSTVLPNVVLHFIFPNCPLIISPKIHNSFFQDILPEYNVIYQLKPNSTNGKTINFSNCSAYVYYEEYVYENNKCYFPIAICFISEYSFFSHYNSFAKRIRNEYEAMTTPLEIILYNLINYAPVSLDNNNQIFWIPSDLLNRKTIVIDKQKTFTALSCSPYIDIKMSEMFKVLPIELIIEVFIFTLLDEQIIFFSENLETLNCIMYLLSTLNFPCVDTTYFGFILSVSKEELVDIDIPSLAIGQPSSIMVGVNCLYDKNLDLSKCSSDVSCVDIDRKVLHLSKNNKQTRDLSTYIREGLNKPIKNTTYFEENLIHFYQRLKSTNISGKWVNEDNKEMTNPVLKQYDFFNFNDHDCEVNNSIQETFFSFLLVLLRPLYSIIKVPKDIDNKIDISRKKFKDLQNKVQLNENEEFIYDTLLNESMKYSQFSLYHAAIDSYRLSFCFCEEFLQLNHSIKEEYKIPHLKIMNDFFIPYKKITDVILCRYDTLIKKRVENSVMLHTNHIIQKLENKIELKSSILNMYLSSIENMDISHRKEIFPLIDHKITFQKISYSSIIDFIEEYTQLNKKTSSNYFISVSIIITSILFINRLEKEDFLLFFQNVIEILINQIKFTKQKQVTAPFLRQQITMYLNVIHRFLKSNNPPSIGNKCLFSIYHQLQEIIIQTELHPNLELMHYLLEINKIDNSLLSHDNEIKHILPLLQAKLKIENKNVVYNRKISEERKKKKYDIYLKDNICLCKDDSEKTKEIVFEIIDSQLNPDKVIISCCKCKVTLFPTLICTSIINNVMKKIDSITINSPQSIFMKMKKYYELWISNGMAFDLLDKTELETIIINLLFYQSKICSSDRIPFSIIKLLFKSWDK